MTFFFEQWAGHQARDAYWSETSVRDHYDRVKVPVFVLSGWQDGYKNSVDRLVRGLAERGHPVQGLLGPWGHKYPFDGYPGPRIDWLRHIVKSWWDRWLKGRPDRGPRWPMLTVWLGESREPDADRVPDYVDVGRWVAEDHRWTARVEEITYALTADGRLSPEPVTTHGVLTSTPDVTLGTSMLETSSWGECSNDDLPADQAATDRRSLHFDGDPLLHDLECFGYPTVRLNLECDRPLASLAIRLCEVSPHGGRSHLVTYRFFNLVHRDGDMANPTPVAPGVFSVRVPLNITGHIFKRGWRVRLSISPSFFPTLWPSPQTPIVTLHTGPVGGVPPSTFVLPGRPRRREDAHIQAILGRPRTAYVDPETYVPTLKTRRDPAFSRTARRVTVEGRPGVLVEKTFDSGNVEYGRALAGLTVDEVAHENYLILDGDPLSATGFTEYDSRLQRGDWRIRAVTRTTVTTEAVAPGETVFRYEAHARAFIGNELFEEKHVTGTIPRRWV